MAVEFSDWTAATHCTGSATPGAKSFMKAVLSLFKGTANGGIYSCRTVVGGSTTSCHGEGRADDVMCSIPVGEKIVKGLLKAGPKRLGIQAIIHNRRIYSKKSPGGRPYVGPGLNPHVDHVHIEFTRAAGKNLTFATVMAALMAVITPEHTDDMPILQLGREGAEVKIVQKAVGVTQDGIFGPKTEAAVKKFQTAHHLVADGVVGEKTWAAILG